MPTIYKSPTLGALTAHVEALALSGPKETVGPLVRRSRDAEVPVPALGFSTSCFTRGPSERAPPPPFRIADASQLPGACPARVPGVLGAPQTSSPPCVSNTPSRARRVCNCAPSSVAVLSAVCLGPLAIQSYQTVSMSVWLTGALDSAMLKKALAIVIARQEGMRINYEKSAAGPSLASTSYDVANATNFVSFRARIPTWVLDRSSGNEFARGAPSPRSTPL